MDVQIHPEQDEPPQQDRQHGGQQVLEQGDRDVAATECHEDADRDVDQEEQGAVAAHGALLFDRRWCLIGGYGSSVTPPLDRCATDHRRSAGGHPEHQTALLDVLPICATRASTPSKRTVERSRRTNSTATV